jgi:hypothetical protein
VAAAAQDPLGTVVSSCTPGGNCDFQKIAGSIQAVGYVLFGVVLLARMLRLAATGRLRSPEHILFDLAPKLVLGVLAIQYFDRVLNDLSQLSMAGAFLVEDATLLPINVLNVDSILSAFPTDGLGVALLPALYVLVAYLLLLVVMSRLVLLLGALISPLGIPIALQNEQGRLAGTWIRMIVSSLLVPVVAGIGAAGSLALAWLVHQVAGDGPLLGSYLGAVAGECGLLFTAFATTAMFRDVVKQGAAGVRGSFEAAHLGPVAGAPGHAMQSIRRGAVTGIEVAAAAAAVPMAASLVTRASKPKPEDPESGTGTSSASPTVPRLPGGSGGVAGDSPPILSAPDVPRLPAWPGEAGSSSQPVSPGPPSPDRPPIAEAYSPRRRVDGGQVIYELERRQLVRYATRLAEPALDNGADPGLGLAKGV